jgi:leucyl-tRNA synthetase
MPRYNPAEIEPRWQAFWEQQRTFATPRLPAQKKMYVLDMFPYPSGEGLHVGHPEGYTATDIVCRYQRMNGVSVMHPMGFDAFGLPAEEHAIRTNTPPRVSTERNIENFVRQLKMLGFSYDWERSLATTDREYFRWTQWIFLILFDTWFDAEAQRGRPISELPIPDSIVAQGEAAVARYRDRHRLAYQDDALVNWCPALGTVLANEEVIDGKSERGGHPVQRLPLRQWMLRITSYADRLLNDLDGLDWPAGIKKLQQDWIGRSVGAEVDFYVGPPADYAAWQANRNRGGAGGLSEDPGETALRVYTTRPDTLYGATYMVVAPEHPLVKRLTKEECRGAVEAYCAAASSKSDRERTEGERRKTGVDTGATAINPVTGQPIPIWVADYVLASYGTGAIMAVPAHDTRDFEFAQAFGLPIVAVVDPGPEAADRDAVLAGKRCSISEGRAVHSGPYDGLPTAEVKRRITDDLQQRGLAQQAVNYKLRDWLFSRQRFWGEPFPILHGVDGQGRATGELRAVAAEELPVDLPHLEDFKPHGRPEPPLEKAPADWLYLERDGRRYKRETNTMPQWAGSCWYYLRFIDPRNSHALVDRELEKAWMPVDLYVGGAEHAVLHLLYARFWHKVLFDRGFVSHPEPFRRLINQGMILGEMEYTGYRDQSGQWVSSADVRKQEDGSLQSADGRQVTPVRLPEQQVTKSGDHFVLVDQSAIRIESRAYKMSKSRGNVVNPDAIVRDYGADSLRLYEMFMGPLEATKPWSMAGVSGVRNFLDRAWQLIIDRHAEQPVLHPAVQDQEPTVEQRRVVHRTIKAVTGDIEQLSFNTAIARLMEFVNEMKQHEVRPRSCLETFVLLLSPFAPHISEELWRALGHTQSLAYETWPTFDPAAILEETLEIPVQVNGKLRGKIEVPREADAARIEAMARANARVMELLDGKQIVKSVVVPGRLVNFVVK